jgi:hypothetical protein
LHKRPDGGSLLASAWSEFILVKPSVNVGLHIRELADDHFAGGPCRWEKLQDLIESLITAR